MWCPSCLVMRKVWTKFEEAYPDLEITDYDYDLDENIVQEFNVGMILPVLIKMDNNQEVGRIIGEKTLDQLTAFIESSSE